MTHKEFIDWLKGYIDGCNLTDELEKIQNKMDEIEDTSIHPFVPQRLDYYPSPTRLPNDVPFPYPSQYPPFPLPDIWYTTNT